MHSPNLPRLFGRQRLLLSLLDAFGGHVDNLRFQKLLFLFCQEPASYHYTGAVASPYDFVPYRYGAFSFTCYADRRRLVDRGLLAEDPRRWVLSDSGRLVTRESEVEVARDFAFRHRHLQGDALVAESYRRHPYYAIRSEIRDRVLRGDADALRRVTGARPVPQPAGLFTIGYEGRSLETYLNVLMRSGVTRVCDVRRNAVSRKYGFAKRTLANACNGVGIHYAHLPELGIESARRKGLSTRSDYAALFGTYQCRILPGKTDALDRIRGWLKADASIVLTCYERDPYSCHRQYVALALNGSAGGCDRSDTCVSSLPMHAAPRAYVAEPVAPVRHL